MATNISLKILTLFFLLGVGALARYRKVIKDESIDNIISIVINIALPFLYFYSLSRHANLEALKTLWFLPLGALLIVGTGYILALMVSPFLKLAEAKKKTFLFLVSFTNYGFLAIPLVYVLFGEEGLFHVIIFNLGFNILFWTFGVWILSADRKNPLKNLVNPGTISLALGILVGIFSIKVPSIVMDASKILGSAAIPTATLAVGAMLAKSFGKRAMNIKAISTLILCRLILVPALIFFIIGFLKEVAFIPKAILLLQAAMPSPSMTPLIARRFGGDPEFAAGGVFFTTLFSLITVTVFMHLTGV